MPSSACAGSDPLSELLRAVRLDGAFFSGVAAAGAWRLEAQGPRELAPRMVPGSEHLIACYIVTEGRCWAGVTGEDQIQLSPGDGLVFPHGDAHLLSSEPGLRAGPRDNCAVPARHAGTVVLGDPGPPETRFVSGYLGCDRESFNPLLAALPRQMHIRGAASEWLGGLARRLTEESAFGSPGSDCIVTRLAELMLIEMLRRCLDELPSGHAGWLAGLRDEVVARAMTLLHARPEYPWDLAELASQSLSSRSSLAKRFMQVVGQPPMQYLAQWRMHLAANMLSEGGNKVAAIGAEVGYDSEAAFSRAFKRATGLAPGAWRAVRRPARRAQLPGAMLRSASRHPMSLR